MVNPAYTFYSGNSKNTTEVEIGWTSYDLINNSVQNRILVHDDGTMSAVWTMSAELNSVWSDRGTGYNFYDGSSWSVSSPNPPILILD